MGLAMLKVTYYASLNRLSIDLNDVVCGECEIIFQVTGTTLEVAEPAKLADDKVPLADAVVHITERNRKFADIVFPHPGVTLINTDQFMLFSCRRVLVADDQINLDVTVNGATAQAAFTVPRPPKPFASWVWTDGLWAAPMAYPNDNFQYAWHEASLSWGTD
jgi:hypothetical protein